MRDWQYLEELDGSDEIVARYTYAPGYIDAVAVQERDLNGYNDFWDADEVVYYHSSTLFSVYALSDASESVIERYRYDAYGACTVLDADGSVDGDGLYRPAGGPAGGPPGPGPYRPRLLEVLQHLRGRH